MRPDTTVIFRHSKIANTTPPSIPSISLVFQEIVKKEEKSSPLIFDAVHHPPFAQLVKLSNHCLHSWPRRNDVIKITRGRARELRHPLFPTRVENFKFRPPVPWIIRNRRTRSTLPPPCIRITVTRMSRWKIAGDKQGIFRGACILHARRSNVRDDPGSAPRNTPATFTFHV